MGLNLRNPQSLWLMVGNDITNANTGNVGIGTGIGVPAAHLEIYGSGNQYLFAHSSTQGATGMYMTNLGYSWLFGNGAATAGKDLEFYDNSSFVMRMVIKETSGNVGINGDPNVNAILDVQSTTKAFMPPRMTSVQKNNVAGPAAGMIVFDTTLSKLCVYSGAAWQTITSV